MTVFRFCTAALVAAGVSACGSITRGTGEMMTFTSEPAGAALSTTKGYGCAATPCSFEVPRSDEFDATFTKPGYKVASVPVRTTLVGKGAAGFAGNVLIGGGAGMVVDAYTGAAYDHTPNPVAVTLVPEALPSAQVAQKTAKAKRARSASAEPSGPGM